MAQTHAPGKDLVTTVGDHFIKCQPNSPGSGEWPETTGMDLLAGNGSNPPSVAQDSL